MSQNTNPPAARSASVASIQMTDVDRDEDNQTTSTSVVQDNDAVENDDDGDYNAEDDNDEDDDEDDEDDEDNEDDGDDANNADDQPIVNNAYRYAPNTWRFSSTERFKIKKAVSPFTHPFVTAWSSDKSAALQSPRCLDEKKIIALSNAIREKPEWWLKYKNPEIVAKWRKEMEDQEVGADIIVFVLHELEFYDNLRKKTGETFQIGCNDYVVIGDKIVPSELKQQLRESVAPLENVSDHLKDWHPGSDEQVLDLVPPSLYPYQYGITPRIPDTESVGLSAQYEGKNQVIAPKFDIEKHTIKNEFRPYGVSRRFQWLPSNFDISEDGKKVTISSYINNLHPVNHKDLYQPIADIFALAIPGINLCLSQYASPEYIRLDPFDNPNGLYLEDVPDFGSASDEDALYDEYMENRRPAPVKVKWEGEPKDRIDFSVNGRKLKVITKLANIELSPEKPDYKGGSWHVEGQINEDIVATVIYYYNSENITTSKLGFRAAYEDPGYEQGDVVGVREIFGLNDEDRMQEEVGSIEAIEDRIVVFPNIMQHRVSPFSLADKTKPGHRKILCFFIVDPFNNNVVSTDQVPPQQADWWNEKIWNDNTTLTQKLPTELLDNILEKVEWPMSLKAAKVVREELMAERSLNEKSADDDEYDGAFSRTFSLCEH